MRNYTFKLILDGQTVGEGCEQGNSAMEAFENAVDAGSVYLPDGIEIDVAAVSDRGIGIRFKAIKGL